METTTINASGVNRRQREIKPGLLAFAVSAMAAAAVRILFYSWFHNFHCFIRMFTVFAVTGTGFITFFRFTFTAVAGTTVNSLLTCTALTGFLSVTAVMFAVAGESPASKNKHHRNKCKKFHDSPIRGNCNGSYAFLLHYGTCS
jgi:hypothetical protein